MYMFNKNQNCVWHPPPPPLNWIYVLLCVVRYCWSANNFSWGSFGLKGNQLRRVGLVFFLTLHQNWILAPSSAFLSSWSSKNGHFLTTCSPVVWLIYCWTILLGGSESPIISLTSIRRQRYATFLFSTKFSKNTNNLTFFFCGTSSTLPGPPWLHSKTMLCLAFLPWVELSLS